MAISLYAALLGLMMVALSVHVIRGRRQFEMAVGEDAHELRRRVRAQGNFAEYTPFFLLLGGLAEYQGMTDAAVHFLGVLFVAGRVMHAYSLISHECYDGTRLLHNPVWRIRGMVCTFVVIGVISIALLVQFIDTVV